MTTPGGRGEIRRGCMRSIPVIFAWLIAVAGCEVTQVSTAAFPSTDPLSRQLVRGASTPADVERTLGHPSGTGSSRLPPDWQVRDVWLYESIKVNSFHRSTPTTGERLTGVVLQADMNQQILLVFFADDRYDGYMWYSNSGSAAAKSHLGIP